MIEIDQLEDGIIKALIHLLYEWIYTVEHGFLLCLIRDDMDIAMDADGELARWLHTGIRNRVRPAFHLHLWLRGCRWYALGDMSKIPALSW